MRPTFPSLGALRLPLNTKRGNKDFYKGTKQAYVPGTNVRTGRPGRFPSSRKALFAVDDTKVRYYVAPPAEVLDTTPLKAYVSHSIDPYEFKQSLKAYSSPARQLPWEAVKQSNADSDLTSESESSSAPRATGLPVTPPFSPLPTQISRDQLAAIPEWNAYRESRAAQLESGEVDKRAAKAGWARVDKPVLRSHDFTKQYRSLRPQEKEALKWQARREWYEGQRALVQELKRRQLEPDAEGEPL